MVMQKIIGITAVLLFLIVTATPCLMAHGGTTYTAKMSGKECSQCKASISKYFFGIKGVESVRIKRLTDSSHQLTVQTSGSLSISKTQAVKSLPKGGHYKIISWTKGHSH